MQRERRYFVRPSDPRTLPMLLMFLLGLVVATSGAEFLMAQRLTAVETSLTFVLRSLAEIRNGGESATERITLRIPH